MTQPVQRYRDWQSRIAGFVASRESTPFAWGSQDCALFTCDAIKEMSGHDPASDVRGYSTAKGAARVVAKLGGMRAIGATRFGPEIHPMQAQVGDVGLVEIDGRESLVLCGGSQWIGAGRDGLVRLEIGVAVMAWRCF
jgi:hypothetical protein